MKKRHEPISLSEYSKHEFDEPLNKAMAHLLSKRCDEIFDHTGKEVLRPIFDNNSQIVKVQSFQYVGVISVHPKLIIQILPKMYNSESDNNSSLKQNIKNLLYMLDYTGKLPNTMLDSSHLERLKDNFYEILIYLYADTLLSEIRNSLHHEYVTQEQNLTYLKGKLNFGKNILANLVNHNRFYLTIDEYDPNNNLNRIFAYVSRQLFLRTSNIKNRQLLSELNLLLSDIEYSRVKASDAEKVKINRLNQRFEPALELAKLFLSGQTLQLNSNTFETASFLIDMNELFEDFVSNLVKQVAGENKVVHTQGPHKYLVEGREDNGSISDEGLFRMKPDITIAEGHGNSYEQIIDAKYKLLNPEDRKLGISQADLYQMYAYSNKYNVRHVTLLYPEQADESIRERPFVIDGDCTVHIKTINLNRDIKKSIASIKNDIRDIISHNYENANAR